jgi:dihydrofolate reductase
MSFRVPGESTVLTHHERAPLEMAGGASTVNQYLAAGVLDQLHLHIAPVLLGASGSSRASRCSAWSRSRWSPRPGSPT